MLVEQKKVVSVIVPVYNAKKYLKRCIDSILLQTYENLEVLLIDDGSIDNSYEICQRYEKSDSRVRAVTRKNEGVSSARNLGLDMARGYYIAFVDSDDYLAPMAIACMVQSQQKSHSELVICSYFDVDETGVRQNDIQQEQQLKGKAIEDWLIKNPFSYYTGVIWNKLYLLSVIKRNQIRFVVSVTLGEDFIFNLQYIRHCHMVCCIKNSLYYYFHGKEQSLSTKEKSILVRVKERNVLYNAYKNFFIGKGVYSQYFKAVKHYLIEYVIAEAVSVHYKKEGNLRLKDKKNSYKILYQSYKKEYPFFSFESFFYGIAFACKSIRYEWCMKLKERYPLLATMRLRELTPIQLLYLFYRCKVVVVLRKVIKKKNILLFCDSTTMEEHLLDYYNTVKELSNVAFYLYYDKKSYPKEFITKRARTMIRGTRIQWIKSLKKAKWKRWELVVCADTFVPEWMNKYYAPILYVNHGLHIISFNGGEDLYTYSWSTYSNGECKFSKMLEANKSFNPYIVSNNRRYEGVVEWVGYKYADDIIKQKQKYSYYRNLLGIQKKETLISIFGSWNTDSLFHTIGKELIQEAKKLLPFGYRFILSIHPREYTNYDSKIVPMGKYIDRQRANGFIVRDPKDSCIPYLIASDYVISDYSSMYELALIAGKPLIFSPFSDERVWKHSIAHEMKREIPVLEKGEDLVACITKCIEKTELGQVYEKYKQQITNEVGQYKQQVKSITNSLLGRGEKG